MKTNMKRSKVEFTGLTIENIQNLIEQRQIITAIPPDWIRIRFEVPYNEYKEIKINDWIRRNIEKKWALYSISFKFDIKTVVVAFEDSNDAVMFKMKNGETVWKTDTEENDY